MLLMCVCVYACMLWYVYISYTRVTYICTFVFMIIITNEI